MPLEAILLKKNTRYGIRAFITGPFSKFGTNFISPVQCSGEVICYKIVPTEKQLLAQCWLTTFSFTVNSAIIADSYVIPEFSEKKCSWNINLAL